MRTLVFIVLLSIASVSVSAQALCEKYAMDSSVFRKPIPAISHVKSSECLPVYVVPQNYYAQHLGFFCRQELILQRAKIPMIFRLGSVEQSNYFEEKPGYK